MTLSSFNTWVSTLGQVRGEALGPEAADFFNRFFPLYTPVLFVDGEPLAPDALVQAGVQAFRNVYAFPTRDFALQVGARLASAVGAERVEAWPVEVSAETSFSIDERALGWLLWLDGYEFPTVNRRWTMLEDGFIWPSVAQAIHALGLDAPAGLDIEYLVYRAYEGLDPVAARGRIDVLARQLAGPAVRGAMYTLPQILAAIEAGNFGSLRAHPYVVGMLSSGQLPLEEAVAKLLPPLRLIGGFRVVPEDLATPPWLAAEPRLEDYMAIALGRADRDQRRRLLRLRRVAEMPRLPSETDTPLGLPGRPAPRLPDVSGRQRTAIRTTGVRQSGYPKGSGHVILHPGSVDLIHDMGRKSDAREYAGQWTMVIGDAAAAGQPVIAAVEGYDDDTVSFNVRIRVVEPLKEMGGEIFEHSTNFGWGMLVKRVVQWARRHGLKHIVVHGAWYCDADSDLAPGCVNELIADLEKKGFAVSSGYTLGDAEYEGESEDDEDDDFDTDDDVEESS